MQLRCFPGECKAAEVGAREQPVIGVRTRATAQPFMGTCPALKYLHENGCPWDSGTCYYAANNEHWDCLQYAVDNKCPSLDTPRVGGIRRRSTRSTSDEMPTINRRPVINHKVSKKELY